MTDATATAVTADSHTHEAGGRAIFWALTSLALNAMFQPSFTGYLWSGDIFKSSLWPHRSSPFVCLADAAADIWTIIHRPGHQSSSSEETERSPAIGVVIKLAIFVLGVLPQAIKLFCMRGVLFAQLIAVAFLVSTIASLARTLLLNDPDEELIDFQERLRQERSGLSFLIELFAWLPSLILIFFVWGSVSHAIHFSVSETVLNAMVLLHWIIALSSVLYLAQHFASIVIFGQAYFGPSMIVMSMLIAGTPDLIGQVFQLRDSVPPFFKLHVTAHVAICCYLVAYLLERIARRLVSQPRTGTLMTDSNDTSTGGQLPATRESDESSSTNRDTVGAPPTSVPVDTPGLTQDHQIEDASRSASQGVSSSTSQNTIPTTRTDVSTDLDVVSEGPSDGENPQSAAKSLAGKTFSAALNIFTWPVVLVLWLCRYAGLWTQESTDQQAEEGRAQSGHVEDSRQPADPTLPATSSDTPHSFSSHVISVVDTMGRFVVRRLLLLVWRILLAFMSAFIYPCIRAEEHLKQHSRDTFWLAFGLVHFVTLSTYYLVFFDGKGTYSPSWTSLFG